MELNNKYRIVYDSENTILQFFEQREINFKDKTTKKNISTGEFKEYTENYYYPNLKTALIGFLNKCTWNTQNAEEVLKEINKVETLINNLK
jgi:hypothetical protein